MSRDMKDGHRGRGEAGRNSRNTHLDVQRAIEGLKDIPDDELQEFLDDEDFNIVDTWEGDEDHEDVGSNRHGRERDSRRHSRDRNRRDRRRGASITRDHRERSKRDERRREEARRDPTKSSKDIERDKIRTKRDNDSKILAEKEKAIKHLLDSDTVVPPGTEVEAIETERLIMDRGQRRPSRERRRTPDRHRVSPSRKKSHDRTRFNSFHRDRSPLVLSPEHRRSPDRRRSSERRRRPSWDRRASAERRERRTSPDRLRRRVEERDIRIVVRRSRSRERRRSRSQERLKRKWSSPGRRGSPRRRTFSKSPERRRKRSPFINEIARQFRDEALMSNTSGVNQFIPPQPMLNTPLLSTPSQNYMPMMDQVGPLGMPTPTSASFIPFDPNPPPPMNFEPVPMHPLPHEYNAPPIMYNQANPMPPPNQFGLLPIPSPQPVPAPISMEPPPYNQPPGPIHRSPSPIRTKFPDSGHYDRERDRDHERHRDRGSSAYNGGSHLSRPDRLKTPEPPVISNPKPFEKTSLSSLLEASVSAKDSGYPVLYPGFKPEILRNCEMALRSLPDEDPRLKMSGRFFFNPSKEEPKIDKPEFLSNSILVQRTRNKIFWEEAVVKKKSPIKPDMYQKYTQTETEMEERGTQTVSEVEDFCVQVCPGDLQPSPPPPIREEKRPIMDRLDWNVRESYEYTPGARDAGDLRWSLSNSRSWNRVSPSMQERDKRTRSPERMHEDRDSRGFDISPMRSRDTFSQSNRRDNFGSRERFSPSYRRSMDHQDDYPDNRSQPRSRGDSPLLLDDAEEVEILEQESFSRESNWRGRGKSSSNKPRNSRAKYSSGRSFRGRGSGYRGKF